MVDSLNHAAYTLYSEEQIGHFGLCEVGESGRDPSRRDKDMPTKQGFQVHQGKGIWCEVEDLGIKSEGIVIT